MTARLFYVDGDADGTENLTGITGSSASAAGFHFAHPFIIGASEIAGDLEVATGKLSDGNMIMDADGASTIGDVDADNLITTNGGIYINPEGTRSTDVNTLDFFEEGAKSCRLVFGVGFDSTYTEASMKYVRIGRLVKVNGRIQIRDLNNSSPAGGARISGLPYPVTLSNSAYSAATIYFRVLNNPADEQIQAYASKGEDYIYLETVTAAGLASGMNYEHFRNGSTLVFQCSYFTDAAL